MDTSTALETAHSVIEGYNKFTLESVLSFRAPHCTHHYLPASLNIGPFNNEEFTAYFSQTQFAFRDFHLTVHDTVCEAAARKVAIHLSSSAATDIGEYRNEYMVVLHLTEDGTMVEKFVEFVDSKRSVEFFARLREHLAGKGKAAL
ncbi:hypothetical protein MMC20_003032 [Loxospora ochrophaea]|nr:hypothetical protein [Loxospora ochrophaea]